MNVRYVGRGAVAEANRNRNSCQEVVGSFGSHLGPGCCYLDAGLAVAVL